MPDLSWNPPTGPPNGAPLRPADARREIDDAIADARARDRELRAQLVELTTSRIRATDRLATASEEASEARALAERALERADEAARAGQRDDADKWTSAAQVFAMRLRDARGLVTSLEQQSATAAEQSQQVESALGENVGRLEAVVASRLPALRGRKAARAQREVDEVVAVIGAPTDDLVERATDDVRAVEADQPDGDGAGDGEAVVTVADEDLESEVDFDGTDVILDELRTELGLAAPHDVRDADATDGSPGAAPDPNGDSEGAMAGAAAGSTGSSGRGRAKAKGKGSAKGNAKATQNGGRRLPAARR